jgi:hypothetical protein
VVKPKAIFFMIGTFVIVISSNQRHFIDFDVALFLYRLRYLKISLSEHSSYRI